MKDQMTQAPMGHQRREGPRAHPALLEEAPGKQGNSVLLYFQNIRCQGFQVSSVLRPPGPALPVL